MTQRESSMATDESCCLSRLEYEYARDSRLPVCLLYSLHYLSYSLLSLPLLIAWRRGWND